MRRVRRNWSRDIARCVFVAVLACAATGMQVTSAEAGVGVTPSKIELAMEPGARTTFEVEVRTDNDTPMVTSVRAWDFARDAQGQIKPVSAVDAEEFHGCSAWVTLPEPVEKPLEPGGSVDFTIEVAVPNGVPDGTRYCYLTFDTSPVTEQEEQEQPAVEIKAPVTYSMSALLLVTVGESATGAAAPVLNDQVLVKAFNVKTFNLDPEVAFTTAIENAGNVHANLSEGSGILIMQGDTVKGEVPFKEYTLLPEQTLDIPTTWVADSPVARYTARFIGFIDPENPLVAETQFWVIEPWVIGASIASLAVLIVIAVFFFTRFRIQLAPRGRDAHETS